MLRRDLIKLLFNKEIGHYLNKSFSQEGEDIILSELFMGNNKGSFVDLGAYHPVQFSNTYSLYCSGWRGINVDATPGRMKMFNRIRKHDTNVELGISHSGGTLNFFRFTEGALNTFDESRLPELESYGYSPIEVLKINTMNIMDFFEKYNVERDFDLLDVDIEGMDEVVIKDIDWEKYRPKVVLTETFNEDNCAHRILISNDYSLFAQTSRTGIYVLK